MSMPSIIFDRLPPKPDELRGQISDLYRADETTVVKARLNQAALDADAQARVEARARELVAETRRRSLGHGGLDTFMQEYDLSSEEGIVLMCLAEALLRIPDAETQDRLIHDKIGSAQWERHLGTSDNWFVNASTWALMLTGRILNLEDDPSEALGSALGRLIARSGEPFIRQAILQGMRIMGRQFVMGRTIGEALERAREAERQGYRYSYDMLGEAARTMEDADRYYESYDQAISAIGKAANGRGPIEAPGISVKLSALHPRYEFAQADRVMDEIAPRLRTLAQHAAKRGIGLTVDAEEADRLDISLDVIEAVSGDPSLKGWDGFGLAVQAYQKRAMPLLDWLADLGKRDGRRFMVRLVKGAYWDTEIKRAQERGLEGYPVFTRKEATDVSYVACARRLLADDTAFYPQFATHNALTLATVLELAGNRSDYEFQRLHGMGEELYDQIVDGGDGAAGLPCRVYAPVGSHEDLLPYLVRRLLENGANTSFVNRIVEEDIPVDELIADPVAELHAKPSKPHPHIPLPRDIFGEERPNSKGIDLSDPEVLRPFAQEMERFCTGDWQAGPMVGGNVRTGGGRAATDPADRRRTVGEVREAGEEEVEAALAKAHKAEGAWDRTPAGDRAAILDRIADLYEANMAELMARVVREGGRTIPDALNEVREAVDFCRYYAARAREHFAEPMRLPGPTGESNELRLHGKGTFVTISPWNFPIAIFTGQTVAALAAGNCVIAKPAEQTPLVGARAIELMHEAGVPGDVLHFLPGDGATVGARLVADPRVAGVAFTGSSETARIINKSLAERTGPIPALIAETGGQNALIVDSSALTEQVVADVLMSSFNSAGQRCSACRVLFVQEDVADRTIEMLAGAMEEMRIGDPGLLSTDVGPVIDDEARQSLENHARDMGARGRLLYEAELPAEARHGTFFPHRAYEIEGIDVLERENFGPILHVVRFKGDKLDAVVDAINGTGYGLTLGIHSRIDTTIRQIAGRAKVGNAYVNRNIVGAVVGVQPFGGEGLSGTGPKAGGPHYLFRFATERALSINTTASGGNAALMTLEAD